MQPLCCKELSAGISSSMYQLTSRPYLDVETKMKTINLFNKILTCILQGNNAIFSFYSPYSHARLSLLVGLPISYVFPDIDSYFLSEIHPFIFSNLLLMSSSEEDDEFGK